MNEMVKTKVIGVDVEFEMTTIAIVDLRGNILARDQFSTANYPNVNNFVEVLAEHIITLSENNGGYESIRSVGMCVPSANFLTGCVENAANMPWKGIVPMAAMLRDSIGIAVALANDAHVMALGEMTYGLAHGMDNFVVVTLMGVGLGSCFFSNGVAHLGNEGFAGEFGHSCIVDGGRQCTCGNKGCLEEYVSYRGIVQTAKDLLESTQTPSILRDVPELTFQSIVEAYDKGDALAIQTWQETGKILGIGLANYASIIDPQAIIITGDLSAYCEKMWDAMESAFRENVFGNIRDKVKLVVSILDEQERNVLGASALAWKVKEYSLFK